MKRLGLLLTTTVLALLFLPLGASAQQQVPAARTSVGIQSSVPSAIVVAPAGGNPGIGAPVAVDNPLPVTCITGCSGSSGGNTTVTATAVAPTYLEGSATNPISAGLKGGIRFTPITPAGVNVDLSLPATLVGADGTTILSNANPLPVSDAGSSLTIDGTVTANLGTIAGVSTAAKQPALGTAGTPSADVISVQGISGGTAVPTANPTLTLGQGTAIAGLTGPMMQVQALTAAPSYSTATINPVSSDVNGAVRVAPMAPGGNVVNFQGTNADALAVASGLTAQVVNSVGRLFNNSSLDRARSVITGTDSIGTGIAAVGLVAQFDDASIVAPTENQFGNLRMAANHALITRPYETSANSWSFAGASGGITNTTTAVTIHGSCGGVLKNYLVSLQISTDTLGAATELAVRDGAGGTVLSRTKLQTAALAPDAIAFSPPVSGTAATLMEVVTLTATVTGGVYVNAQGYCAP